MDLLANGYEQTGQAIKAFKVRLDAAEDFEKAGDREAARAVFSPIRGATAPKELKFGYEGMKTTLEGGQDAAILDQPAHRNLELFRAPLSSNSLNLAETEVREIQESLGDFLRKERPVGTRTL